MILGGIILDKVLEKIAREYIEKAEETFEFILELLNVEDKYQMTQLVREKNYSPFVREGTNYVISPHGRGCFFSDGKEEIDWDFGDNRICGINCGLLKRYIDFYYPQLTNEFTYIKIKEEFEKAFVNGVATKRYDLYYLV
jgi:hypothetical protein